MRAILYVVFQCLGACTGSALVLAVNHPAIALTLLQRTVQYMTATQCTCEINVQARATQAPAISVSLPESALTSFLRG